MVKRTLITPFVGQEEAEEAQKLIQINLLRLLHPAQNVRELMF